MEKKVDQTKKGFSSLKHFKLIILLTLLPSYVIYRFMNGQINVQSSDIFIFNLSCAAIINYLYESKKQLSVFFILMIIYYFLRKSNIEWEEEQKHLKDNERANKKDDLNIKTSEIELELEHSQEDVKEGKNSRTKNKMKLSVVNELNDEENDGN